jgi:hypothetical protein
VRQRARQHAAEHGRKEHPAANGSSRPATSVPSGSPTPACAKSPGSRAPALTSAPAAVNAPISTRQVSSTLASAGSTLMERRS